MESPVTGFSHLQLVVRDVPTSERWWTAVFDMDRLTAAEDGSYVALRHRPSRVVVVLTAGGDGGETRLDHVAFAVPDGPTLEAWAAELTARGIDHPGVVDELGKPSLVLEDPDGNHVELVAPPGT